MLITDQLKEVLSKANSAHGYVLIGEDVEKIKNALVRLFKEEESNSTIVSPRTTEPSAWEPQTAPLGAVKNNSLAIGRDINKSPLIDTEFFASDISGSLGIDSVRRLKEFLSSMAVKSSRRTAVIVGGDNLTSQAQNALLKISEDPPPNARIFLIVKSEENLLPTLRSRLQKIYITRDATLSGGTNNNLSDSLSDNLSLEVAKLANQFLKGDAKARSEIIKLVTGKGEGVGEDKTKFFLDSLIFELGKEPVKNSSFLGAILERQALITQYSLNKRLQLELLSSLWYNNK